MSTIKAFFLGGALGTVIGGITGGIVGGKLGRYLAERESKKAMKYMGIQEVSDDILEIQSSFEEYAMDFGKRLETVLGDGAGTDFAEMMKQKCFLNDDQGNVIDIPITPQDANMGECRI